MNFLGIRSQSNKYFKLMDSLNLDKKKNISDTIMTVNALHKELCSLKLKELKLLQTEVNSVVEDYKQNSILISIVGILAMFLLACLNRFNITQPVTIGNVTGLLDIQFLVTGITFMLILYGVFKYTKGYKQMYHFQAILNMSIEEKENPIK